MTTPRLSAARALAAIERGRTTLSAELERERPALTDPRDRALFQEIVAGTLRWRALLDACLATRSRRPLDALTPEVRSVLRVGAYQLLFLARVPVHAAVSEAVESVRIWRQPGAAGFVNAVLRGLTRPPDPRSFLPARPRSPDDIGGALDYLSVTLSHPRWLVSRWLARVGFDAAEAWCHFNNAPPTTTLRPAAGIATEDLLTRLHEEGIDARAARFMPGAITLPPGSLGRLPDEIRPRVIVHDEASQLVALAVGAMPGDRVLDVCASPGGKTMLLGQAVAMAGLVVAADFRPARVSLLAAQLRRAAVSIPIVRLDARQPLPFQAVFDRVLVDAPCSGLGTLRRDPDLKWSRSEAGLAELADAQVRLLSAAAAAVRPGGLLVYATCSSEPEENDGVVERFQAEHPEFRPAPVTLSGVGEAARLLDHGRLRTRPDRDHLDAFFAAALVRSEPA